MDFRSRLKLLKQCHPLFLMPQRKRGRYWCNGEGEEQHGANNASHSHQLPWPAFNMEIGNGISPPPFSLDLHVNEASG